MRHLSLALLLAACAADPPPGSSASDAAPAEDAGARADAQAPDAEPLPDAALPYVAENYCESMVDAFCGFYLRCGRISSADPPACRADFLAQCNALYEGRYRALERAGLLTLSPSGVELCRAHLSTVACEQQIKDLDGPCGALWTGTATVGAGCGLDVESFVCEPGSTCVLGLDLCGTCKLAAATDEACGGDVSCARTDSCVMGSCRRRPLPGEACADVPCALGASCQGGACVAPSYAGLGEACDAAHRCPYGASCLGGRCVEGGRLGDACSASAPCGIGRCDAFGRCSPQRATGESCSTSLDCAEGPCVDMRCTALPDACAR